MGRTTMTNRTKAIILAAAFIASFLFGLIVPAWSFAATALPDYTITGYSGSATVAPGGTFTRTVTVSNIGDGTDKYGVNATINGIYGVYVDSVTGPGFTRCGVYKFSTGALNYVRCFAANPAPGQSVTMTVTYRVPSAGRLGWVYNGGAYARLVSTSMDAEATTTNNYTGFSVTTTVVAAS